MANRLNPYISFQGNAKEAIEFYKSIFGGELTMSTFGQAGVSTDPAFADQLMHGMLVAQNGMTLMVSDTPPGMSYNDGSRISISLSGDNGAELTSYWEKLSEGATITVPFAPAPWGDTFGMLTDKFGVFWMVDIVAGSK